MLPTSASSERIGDKLSVSGGMASLTAGKMNKSLTNAVNVLFSFIDQSGDMDPTKIGLFDLAEKRLAWTAQRQTVLAANIANANTPGFEARDVTSFAQVLSGTGTMAPAQTQPGHMSGTLSAAV